MNITNIPSPLRLTEVSSVRGAPMGRHMINRTNLLDPLFKLERVPLVDGAYDCGGAYWGAPDNLWCADFTTPRTGTVIVHTFVRAPSRIQAMEIIRRDYPSAKFANETGSIIEQTINFLKDYLHKEDGADEDTVVETMSEIEHWQEHLDRLRGAK